MSVPVNQRSEGKLAVIVQAKELAEYTIRITNNPKNFSPIIDTTTTAMMKQSAIRIYQLCRQANKLPLKERLDDRRRMQNLAIAQCDDLCGLTELAKGLFHLASKRCRYWTDMTYKLQGMIKSWRDSDSKRE